MNAIQPSQPTATTFSNLRGTEARLYIKGNPWQSSNGHQKVFLHCISCGAKRFSDQDWKDRKIFGVLTTACNHKVCYKRIAYFPGVVPRNFLYLNDPSDKERWSANPTGEFTKEIGEKTVCYRSDDHVYPRLKDSPAELKGVVKELENIPIEMRLARIDEIYFDYREKNNIEVGQRMSDANDPFLQALSAYRQKCAVLLRYFC